jgi:hypothetical protein
MSLFNRKFSIMVVLADGWRLVTTMRRGSVWHACVADGGAVAVVTGQEPALLLDQDRQVPLHTDLRAAGECSIGQRGGAILQRGQLHRSAAYGDPRVRPERWPDVDTRLRHRGIHHDRPLRPPHRRGPRRVLDLLDADGAVIRTDHDVRSALFTRTGELVAVTMSGELKWLPAR